jgi:hypothetical protein
MSDIHESISVDVPFDRIPELAEQYLASLRNGSDDAVAPLSFLVGDVVVERDVRLAIVPTRRYWGYEILDIRWEANRRGPYPAFKGTLCADYASTMSCRLDLDGSYVPPGGVAGAAFDAVIGNCIARAVTQRLLQRFKRAFEETYRERSLAASSGGIRRTA